MTRFSVHARTPDFEPKDFRTALGRFPTGVTIVTARDDNGEPVGLTVSSFNSLSLHPPLILCSLALRSRTLPLYERIDRYAVHVLAAGQARLARQFATVPGRDRFADVAWDTNEFGTPRRREGVAARIEFINLRRHEAGDHRTMVGMVPRW